MTSLVMSGFFPSQPVEDQSNSGENCYISYLPSETLTQVFSYLSAEDLVACAKTCTLWREIINSSERIWRSLCMSLTESFANIRQDRLHGFSWRVCIPYFLSTAWIQTLFGQPLISLSKNLSLLHGTGWAKENDSELN